MRKRIFTACLATLCLSACGLLIRAQEPVRLDIDSHHVEGQIDPLIYGQLFEHIYFSANNGVWQEIVYGRSFEPEHYPGIPPRDGYFDGWFADADGVLHSPTRYEQPIPLTEVDTDSYDLEMDVAWRAYRLPNRRWSGGLLDLRFAFKDQEDGEPYFLRLYDPAFEGQRFNLAQTAAQVEADNQAKALAQAQKQASTAEFSIATRVEKEVSFFGNTRKVQALEPLATAAAQPAQTDQSAWHRLKISCRGSKVTVWWDGAKVLNTNLPTSRQHNVITLWENYTEARFRNISVRDAKGRQTFFEGLPQEVAIPEVAPEWTAFGEGSFRLVKGDAVNMEYAQQISAQDLSGLQQGPQAVRPGDAFVGSVYAKGDGQARLTVGLRRDGRWVARQELGTPSADWKCYEFTLDAGAYEGDADFAIAASDGTLLIDQASMGTHSGQALGGFRPDIFEAVQALHPTCLRWPGGGYAAQYDWKWGIGPQKDRKRWDHWMWMDYDQNCFGTDEFIQFCRAIGSEPVIVVSVGFERPESEYDQILQNAVDWLRYCNEPATGKWGAVRAANGHPEPYNVKYWEIDNEMWEMGIERYERCVRDYSAALRAVDPDIKIIACGGFPEDEAFLMRSGGCFDYLSLHHYEQAGGYASGPGRLAEQYKKYARMIAACPNPDIKLFISEWNLNSTDWRTGLFAGGFLNVCEQLDVVAMGAAALFIRRTDAPDWDNAFINFDYKDLFVAPNYQVTELWYDHFAPNRLAVSGDAKELSVSASRADDNGIVTVKVVNPTDKPYSLTLAPDWSTLATADYDYIAPGSLDAANDMEHKQAVQRKRKALKPAGNTVTFTVDPLSAGVVTLSRKEWSGMDFYRHVYLDVDVEGKEAHFVLDTGAPYSIPDSTFLADNGLKYKKTFKAKMGGTGDGKTTVTAISNEFTYSIGSTEYTSQVSPIIGLKSILGDYADGLVGLGEVGDAVIAIDFQDGRIGFWDKVDADDVEGYTAIPVEYQKKRILIPIRIRVRDGITVEGKFIMDLGNPYSASLTRVTSEKYGLEAVQPVMSTAMAVGGIGGSSSSRDFRALGLDLGPFTLDDILMEYSLNKEGALAEAEWDGLLGNEVWSRFDMIIDAPNGVLYLRPNETYADPFECPVMGFSATYRTQTLGCWVVNAIHDGSNAQKAGLRGGDRIVAVNGRDVKTYSHQAYRTWSEGLHSVCLTVLRDGKEQEISFDFDEPRL